MDEHRYNLEQAYEVCRTISLGHYENFPVGSLLIPKHLRRHFYSLYAFMRTADDFADLPHRTKEERLSLLADWRRQLEQTLRGEDCEHPIFFALRATIKECNLSGDPLRRLLEAFEFDATGEVGFESFDDLRWYTSRSADPVGELILSIFTYSDPSRIQLSSEICTGLQLLNFIQDCREDLANGRYYYPASDYDLFGVDPSSPDMSPQRLALVSLFELERVEALLDRGSPLAESVRGRLRYELRAIIIGARKLASKIKKSDGNSYLTRPKLSKWEHFTVLFESLVRRVDKHKADRA